MKLPCADSKQNVAGELSCRMIGNGTESLVQSDRKHSLTMQPHRRNEKNVVLADVLI